MVVEKNGDTHDIPAYDLPSGLDIGDTADSDYSLIGRLSKAVGEVEKQEIPEDVREKSGPGAKYIGKYLVLQKVASGGMGNVYKCYDFGLGRYVAIKVLHNLTGPSVSRFKFEARALAMLKHPNIVQVYDSGEYEGSPFLVMQFVDGSTLDSFIGKKDTEEILRIVIKVCDAISYAHGNGILHRDLKPHNILVDNSGNAYVTDFGLAKYADSIVTRSSVLVGTPHYMAPEQIEGKGASILTDVYSIGAMLYHSIACVPPFDGETQHEILNRIVNGEMIPITRFNPDIDPALARIICKSMERDSSFRYASVKELKDDLARFIAGDPVAAGGTGIIYLLKRYLSKRRMHILFSIVVLAIILLSYLVTKNVLDEKIIEAERVESRVLPYFEKGRKYFSIAKNAKDPAVSVDVAGSIRLALQNLTEAINISNSYADAYLYRGLTNMLKADYGRAIQDFSRAIEYSPALSEAYYMRVFARFRESFWRYYYVHEFKRLSRDVIVQIRDDIQKLKELDVFPERLMVAKSLLMHINGRGKKALELLDASIATNPTLLDAYLVRGHIKFHSVLRNAKTGDDSMVDAKKSEVVKDLMKMYTLDSNLPPDYQDIVFMLTMLSSLDEAERLARVLVAIDPGNPNFLGLQCLIYALNGSLDKATGCMRDMSVYEENDAKDYDVSRYYFLKGQLLGILGMRDKSIEYYDMWYEALPDDEQVRALDTYEMVTRRSK